MRLTQSLPCFTTPIACQSLQNALAKNSQAIKKELANGINTFKHASLKDKVISIASLALSYFVVSFSPVLVALALFASLELYELSHFNQNTDTSVDQRVKFSTSSDWFCLMGVTLGIKTIANLLLFPVSTQRVVVQAFICVTSLHISALNYNHLKMSHTL